MKKGKQKVKVVEVVEDDKDDEMEVVEDECLDGKAEEVENEVSHCM
jgi:hypothetical protein